MNSKVYEDANSERGLIIWDTYDCKPCDIIQLATDSFVVFDYDSCQSQGRDIHGYVEVNREKVELYICRALGHKEVKYEEQTILR